MESIAHTLNGRLTNLYTNVNQNSFSIYGTLVLFLFLFLSTFQANATHVVGGGITYVQLENNDYLLTVKLYRDCSPGTAQLPNNVDVECRR